MHRTGDPRAAVVPLTDCPYLRVWKNSSGQGLLPNHAVSVIISSRSPWHAGDSALWFVYPRISPCVCCDRCVVDERRAVLTATSASRQLVRNEGLIRRPLPRRQTA